MKALFIETEQGEVIRADRFDVFCVRAGVVAGASALTVSTLGGYTMILATGGPAEMAAKLRTLLVRLAQAAEQPPVSFGRPQIREASQMDPPPDDPDAGRRAD